MATLFGEIVLETALKMGKAADLAGAQAGANWSRWAEGGPKAILIDSKMSHVMHMEIQLSSDMPGTFGLHAKLGPKQTQDGEPASDQASSTESDSKNTWNTPVKKPGVGHVPISPSPAKKIHPPLR